MANRNSNRLDNEMNTYVEVNDSGSTEVAQRVKVTGLGSLLEGVKYDFIAATYPSTTQEVYTYKTGGSGGTTVAVITVNYTTSTKDVLLDVSKA
jgi:hypothetical protein